MRSENRIKESRFPYGLSNEIQRSLYGRINPSAVTQLLQGSWVQAGEGEEAGFLLPGLNKKLLNLEIYQMLIPKFKTFENLFF
jgi:hypothetical protein